MSSGKRWKNGQFGFSGFHGANKQKSFPKPLPILPSMPSEPDNTGWTDDAKTPIADSKTQQDTIEFTPKAKLRFTAYSWAKLRYMRDKDNCEVSGMAITSPDDPLLIEDIRIIKQKVSIASIELDDEAVANFFDDMVDAGRQPVNFARIWIHTHPGSSASPSTTDESTFSKSFGRCNWSIMMILAKGGEVSCRLRINDPLKFSTEIPVIVDYSVPFQGSNHSEWDKEFTDNVTIEHIMYSYGHGFSHGWNDMGDGFDYGDDWEGFHDRSPYYANFPPESGYFRDSKDTAWYDLSYVLATWYNPTQAADILKQMGITAEEAKSYNVSYDSKGILIPEHKSKRSPDPILKVEPGVSLNPDADAIAEAYNLHNQEARK